jgi:hypothetical protein
LAQQALAGGPEGLAEGQGVDGQHQNWLAAVGTERVLKGAAIVAQTVEPVPASRLFTGRQLDQEITVLPWWRKLNPDQRMGSGTNSGSEGSWTNMMSSTVNLKVPDIQNAKS